MDPNKEFKKLKYSYGSPRPEQRVIMIRCDATNCGHKMLINHDVWISRNEIQCPNCGETLLWSTL